MTFLCVPIFVRTVEQARADAFRAVEHGADYVELRIDPMVEQQRLAEDVRLGLQAFASRDVARLAAELGVPCVVTCRGGDEGGLTRAEDADRFTALASVAHDFAEVHRGGPPLYVDVEWHALRLAGGWPLSLLQLVGERPGVVRTVLSFHDLQGRPSTLLSTVLEMSQSRGDVNKIAWRARSVRDNVEAFELLREAARPTIAICMGEDGLFSRVLAKKFNAFLSFASVADGQATADGQVTVKRMKELYRWDAVARDTKVYGVVAHPVTHSRSPHVHNAAFDATGFDGVYLPVPVQPGYESFKATIETLANFAPLDLGGLSVTLPHKENALRYCRELAAAGRGSVDAKADRVGAVNTLVVDRAHGEPTLSGHNTDYDAILDTVTAALGCGRGDLQGVKAAVLGAGGVGLCAAAALADYGADVTVYNRTFERAKAVAGHVGRGAKAASLDEAVGEARIVVNGTSVGMHPDTDASPLPADSPLLSPDTLVFDTIYNPTETKLMRDAAARGARVVGGRAMFLHQAAAQFRLWTGQDTPAEAMRRAFDAAG